MSAINNDAADAVARGLAADGGTTARELAEVLWPGAVTRARKEAARSRLDKLVGRGWLWCLPGVRGSGAGGQLVPSVYHLAWPPRCSGPAALNTLGRTNCMGDTK